MKFIAAWCCLMLAWAPVAVAQSKNSGGAPGSAPASTPKGQEKVNKTLRCAAQAEQSKLKPGMPEFERFMAGCNKG